MLKKNKSKLKPLSLDAYKNILMEKWLTNQYDSIILSGSEVTENKDILKFVKFASKLNNLRHIRIQTNGRNLSDINYCNKLLDAGVDEFFISVYGPKSQIHDKITRVRNSFNQTMRGINNLSKLNASVFTNTVIIKLNYMSLPQIASLFSKNKNVKEMQFWNFWPMDTGDVDDLLVSNKKIHKYLISATKKALEGKKVSIKNYPECMLDNYAYVLDNSQPDIIVDPMLWDEFRLNQFGNCIYKKTCRNTQCYGLTTAYINKFGWDETILKPIQ
jgi:MoaA/NifB/PqqE/SkfB family radical SAM enzyme